ncbi:MAG: Nitrogen fixation protein VnfA [Phycisphaerae bacterium]|nr:Nitrogen fixation protein VnfA [Phycisphaerae bacterium]
MAVPSSAGLSPQALSALFEATTAINSSLDLPRVLQAIAQSAAAVMRAEASSVLLLDKRRDRLVFKAAVGDRSDALIGEEFDASLGVAGRVCKTGQPEVVTDVSKNKHFFKGIDDKSSFKTRGLIAAPLLQQGEILGVVEVLNKLGSDNFANQDIELLQIFANLAANGVRNAQAHDQLQKENEGLRTSMRMSDQIVGQSEALQQVLNLCNRVAPTNASVLLLGETGTGKEVFANYIHNRSPRRDKPFIAINCAALAETLLESELFGHEKGSFTGAVAQKIGRFELADNGSLFLDEIGEISPSVQVKLLRVLQEREFVRVGGTKTIACDVRILAATNRNLQKEMEEKRFREDLFYRLNVFPIHIPPLRERREDIALLVHHFTVRAATDMKIQRPEVDDDAMAALLAHRWPGNIRELQNVIERAVLMSDGQHVQLHHLPTDIAGHHATEQQQSGDSSLWGYERAMIIKALQNNRWNQSKAARELGISRDNLRYRVKKYNIQRPGS